MFLGCWITNLWKLNKPISELFHHCIKVSIKFKTASAKIYRIDIEWLYPRYTLLSPTASYHCLERVSFGQGCCVQASHVGIYRVINLKWQKVLSFCTQTIDFSKKYKKWLLLKFIDVLLSRKYSLSLSIGNPQNTWCFVSLFEQKSRFFREIHWSLFHFVMPFLNGLS